MIRALKQQAEQFSECHWNFGKEYFFRLPVVIYLCFYFCSGIILISCTTIYFNCLDKVNGLMNVCVWQIPSAVLCHPSFVWLLREDSFWIQWFRWLWGMAVIFCHVRRLRQRVWIVVCHGNNSLTMHFQDREHKLNTNLCVAKKAGGHAWSALNVMSVHLSYSPSKKWIIQMRCITVNLPPLCHFCHWKIDKLVGT